MPAQTCLIVCTALKRESKTQILARAMAAEMVALGMEVDLFDLAAEPLPACDGASCYALPAVQDASARVKRAAVVVFCSPIYNYQVNSAAKNFLELTNSGWPEKLVGIVANAGGERSFLAVLSLVNSLWLDHHCLIAPRFVYATGTAFAENGTIRPDGDVPARMKALATELHRLATRLVPDATRPSTI